MKIYKKGSLFLFIYCILHESGTAQPTNIDMLKLKPTWRNLTFDSFLMSPFYLIWIWALAFHGFYSSHLGLMSENECLCVLQAKSILNKLVSTIQEEKDAICCS